MSGNPAAATSQKSTAIFIAALALPTSPEERERCSVLIPFVSRYASNLYESIDAIARRRPIRIAMLLGEQKSGWGPGLPSTAPSSGRQESSLNFSTAMGFRLLCSIQTWLLTGLAPTCYVKMSLLPQLISEEDKRATTNVQNGLVFLS